ncbi:hypothetical protein [Jiangella mangrovi]|uniref:Uncharacterized protein n=1 Tax=Jiangella mangrovi TaxID=1524084 RepID=A0A7W9GU49_9ACTN|nr:hypothetical protein [Jiangella mangrovi]MBB5790097.1 hypothetical protein [Jiangella mangrovi]
MTGRSDHQGGGYEDPAQQPRDRASDDRPSAFEQPEERQGRWPGSTVLLAVIVVLFLGLLLLGLIGWLASR